MADDQLTQFSYGSSGRNFLSKGGSDKQNPDCYNSRQEINDRVHNGGRNKTPSLRGFRSIKSGRPAGSRTPIYGTGTGG